MFFAEHNPPHFHVRYGDFKAVIEIASLRILGGSLPPRAYGLVAEWAMQHRGELERNWSEARENHPPLPIPPLP